MKIEITKKRYRTLLEMIDIADNVLHLHRIADAPETREYRELIQWFLSYAKEMGCEDVVEYAPQSREYILMGWEEDDWKPRELIEEFEEDVFWEELARRLALRDIIQEHGPEKLAEMDRGTVFVKRLELEQRYAEEFERNGLANLRLPVRLS